MPPGIGGPSSIEFAKKASRNAILKGGNNGPPSDEFEQFHRYHQPGSADHPHVRPEAARSAQENDPTEQIDIVEAAESHVAAPDARQPAQTARMTQRPRLGAREWEPWWSGSTGPLPPPTQ